MLTSYLSNLITRQLRALSGFGARIALDSGKRCDSASRYIEYRERRRGHVGAEERDPRDDSQCRAPRLAAGVTVSKTGHRRESFLQVQAHARKQPSRAQLFTRRPCCPERRQNRCSSKSTEREGYGEAQRYVGRSPPRPGRLDHSDSLHVLSAGPLDGRIPHLPGRRQW